MISRARWIRQRLIARPDLSLVVVGGAVLAGLVAWVILGRRRARGEGMGRSDRRRFILEHSWTLPTGADLSTVASSLVSRLGFSVLERSEDSVELSCGSELKMRLLGGDFLLPSQLPIRVQLAVTEPESSERRGLTMRLRDGIRGPRVRDIELLRRFELAGEQVVELIDGALGSAGETAERAAAQTSPPIIGPRTRDLFGIYFHEDWTLEGPTWRDVIQSYLRQEEPSERELSELRDELDELIATRLLDEELSEWLYRDAGLCYYPPGLGQSCRDWLRELQNALSDAAGDSGSFPSSPRS